MILRRQHGDVQVSPPDMFDKLKGVGDLCRNGPKGTSRKAPRLLFRTGPYNPWPGDGLGAFLGLSFISHSSNKSSPVKGSPTSSLTFALCASVRTAVILP